LSFRNLFTPAGYRADPGKTESFKGKASETYFIGDCVKTRLIRYAIEDGFEAGRKL
jgi:hypothetical protein